MLDRTDFLAKWDKRLEWPLACVAGIFLAAYSVQVLAQPSGIARAVLSAVVAAAWLVFAVDYIVRLAVAPEKGRWFVRHLLDLAVVALPLLRPLRLLRLVILFGALQKAVGGAIRGRVVIYTAASAVLLIYVASLAILEAERSRGDAVITTFGDAVWWSITTVTTVGYGDYAPVTTTGRIIAALLMIGGISLIGIVTATLASWIVQRVAQEDAANQVATGQQIQQLHDELVELRIAINRSQMVRAEGFEPPTAGV
ncbi:potassium channel family protein [Williamsia phyllosphaerae]|uniref:Voltage-gated potassium channel n=1 Tax=Williamsia phyllosphaerae TaxID=885042 RepID=A0ABQ1UYE8_9NOCA|nr:potassium channel family protein [Williamsia phyllosphaerae]GGF28823.1 voltage-gated potassium channel [Williamsia phyllosphaerae]